jgi:hypothetical protein
MPVHAHRKKLLMGFLFLFNKEIIQLSKISLPYGMILLFWLL